jgi:hypothetical protein
VGDTFLPIDTLLGRDKHDRYYTPQVIADTFVRWLQVPMGADVLEPSVGGGAWLRALTAHGHDGGTTAVDIDPDAAGLALADHRIVGDFAAHTGRGYDLCLGNPPFGATAGEHLAVALGRAKVVAWLLRSSFTEQVQARRDLLRAHPPWAVWMWPHRIKFGGAKGSDSVLHGLHIWVRGHTGDSWTTTMCRPDDPEWMPPAVPWGGL